MVSPVDMARVADTAGAGRPRPQQDRRGQALAATGRSASAQTQKLARLGLLLAMAVALQVLESQLPSLPIPGAKLGLANLVSLLVILLWGWREALLLVVTRQLLGSLATGTFLSTPFLFGLAGGVASVITMSLAVFLGARRARQQLSIIGISLIGAVTHNCTQLLVAWALTGVPAIFSYLPLLLWFSLPAGALIGALAHWLWPQLAQLQPAATSPAVDARRSVNQRGPAAAKAGRRLSRWFSRLNLRPADLAVALVTILAATVLTVARQTPSVALPHPVAVVTVNGHERLRLPMDQDQQIVLPVNGGRMVIQTSARKVRVLTSTCPDKICVKTGWIENPAQTIVCVPYRTVIRVQGGPVSDYDVVSS